ncbi:tRNA (adenosine(37)-N6)-threonylcarbamoyltransferase complex ATPase subunit type 1 TsaE [Pseudovibrio exalbescens]|uniref:tRNA (adenosine(37)-N6)-threonylcarbamoyltransferase complex ATPase subunit type 1 TsaE n=1 Tax=Pseudovibrio exalbescens TaxID=197461 RepID=UPI0023663C5A|nr:tRNA (adenosine(37)-N6)-threonylcarbamoyltransferase complex ATPase subunit type 1 TsaE [Pseudovibrio exalbescens]MDD7909777.1 tRNA (adenosine(37)-N6)-threonylcarbamoyltransferase complex ATPase subunit type 1 TsaE [Pseudovibrio exalbescens]
MIVTLYSQAETERFAEDFAEFLKPGDVIALSGDLGTGKSTFSRALLRYLAGEPELEVPSPTFTLVQTYDLERLFLAHMDLYRLEEPEELEELGLEDTLERGAALVEWPEMGDARYWPEALLVKIEEGPEPDSRIFTLTPQSSDWDARLKRLQARRELLLGTTWMERPRDHLKGDASTRSYLRLNGEAGGAVLMDYPPRAGEATLPSGKTYAQSVHLAHSIDDFLAIAEELRHRGLRVPEIYALDRPNGLALMEDLGTQFIVQDGAPIADRYKRALDVLLHMHQQAWPETARSGDATHALGRYDLASYMTEAELFMEFYRPHAEGKEASSKDRTLFKEAWQKALAPLEALPKTWVMRDFHSPNLLWLDRAEGLDQIAQIDFQDALIGPIAYDVASLVMDARLTIPRDLQEELLAHYCEKALKYLSDFDEGLFRYGVATLAAHRNTKILGGFVRLNTVFGKPAYLEHLPRIREYLVQALSHPELEELKTVYDVILPSNPLLHSASK